MWHEPPNSVENLSVLFGNTWSCCDFYAEWHPRRLTNTCPIPSYLSLRFRVILSQTFGPLRNRQATLLSSWTFKDSETNINIFCKHFIFTLYFDNALQHSVSTEAFASDNSCNVGKVIWHFCINAIHLPWIISFRDSCAINASRGSTPPCRNRKPAPFAEVTFKIILPNTLPRASEKNAEYFVCSDSLSALNFGCAVWCIQWSLWTDDVTSR